MRRQQISLKRSEENARRWSEEAALAERCRARKIMLRTLKKGSLLERTLWTWIITTSHHRDITQHHKHWNTHKKKENK